MSIKEIERYNQNNYNIIEVKTMKKVEDLSYELVIVGGGMSGLCAAIAAARNNVKTALIHARPVLGGNASGEVRIHISSATDGARKPELEETGILYEMMLTNKARNPHYNYDLWDMTMFEAAKNEKNLDLYLNTSMVDAYSENNRITKIFCFQQTTEKHLYFSAPLFVDATGNGTLGYFVDAEYRIGSEAKSEFNEPHAPESENKDSMGNTILFRAIDTGKPVKFTPPSFAKKLSEEDLKYRVHCERHKMDYSMAEDPEDYKRVSATSSNNCDYGYWWIELMGKNNDIIGDYEDIRDELFSYFYGVWDHIKNGGDHGADNLELLWVGALPGTRESRRMVGDYILNETDIWNHRQFDDAVCYGGWGVDLHTKNGLYDLDKLPSQVWNFPGTYTIPYRCYYSKNITNLFYAGRNISCSKMAMASTRIIGTCAIGGQVVGTAAELCKKYNCSPRGLSSHIPTLQQQLLKDDLFIPGIVNQDEHDLAKYATVHASSFMAEHLPEKVTDGLSRNYDETIHSWCSNGISSNGESLTLKWDKPQKLSQLRLTFNSNFNYAIRITMAPKRQAQQRIGLPPELVKNYTVQLYKNKSLIKTINITDNIQRLNVIDFEKTECDEVKFNFTATNGSENVEVFEIRAY